MTFPFPFVAPKVAPSISFRATASDTTDLSTYTFSGMDIGTAGGNRRVVVACGGVEAGASAALTVSSATIGGVSATIVQQQGSSAGSGAGLTAILIAFVPTGATGDVVINLNTAAARFAASTFAVYDLVSGTAVATATSQADPSSLNLNTQIGDIIVACGFSNGGGTVTWTGATEQTTAAPEGTIFSPAMHTATSAETPRTIEGNFSTASLHSGVSAVWR